MDFGHGGGPRPSWGGVPDDGYMRGATMPPSADFGAVISRIPTEQGGGIYNPGPSAADASTQMFGKPHGELFLGPQDSKISAASFAPIVHSLFVRDIGAGTYTEGERFFTKGHLMAVLRLHKAVEEKSITRKMRRSLNKRWQSKIEPTNAILGPVYNEALGTTPLVGYECTGLFPLSEGSFFTPHRDTEQLAITIHDHAEVVTENPKDVEKILTRDSGNDALWQYLKDHTSLYNPDNVQHLACIASALWVVPIVVREAAKDCFCVKMIPVTDPDQLDLHAINGFAHAMDGDAGLVHAIAGIYHIGTLKQTFTHEDETWTLTFSPHV